jgi:hypothetical protein
LPVHGGTNIPRTRGLEIAADDHESEEAAAFDRIYLDLGKLEHAYDVIATPEAVRIGF